jgi:hypothetical protein
VQDFGLYGTRLKERLKKMDLKILKSITNEINKIIQYYNYHILLITTLSYFMFFVVNFVLHIEQCIANLIFLYI